MKSKIGLFISAVLLLSTVLVQGSYSQDRTNEGFAGFLFSKGEYYRAMTEYYRMLYNETDSTKRIHLLKNIGLCYYSGEDYEGYSSFFQNNKCVFLLNPGIYSEMNLYQGMSYYHRQSYEKALSILEKIIVEPEDSLSDRKYLFISLSYAHLYDWKSASQNMDRVAITTEYGKFREYLQNQKNSMLAIPTRDPSFAGILSAVLPGSGYIYCDRIMTGLTSFLVNGLLMWASYDAAHNKQYGLTAGIGFFGLGWYIGNIIGSVDAARQYNSSQQEKYLEAVLPKNIK